MGPRYFFFILPIGSFKKLLTFKSLVILVGALVLTLALFAPTRFKTVCPQGLTSDPVPGGSCSLFIDQNQDTLCDYLYPTAIPTTPHFDFQFLPEAVVFFLFLLIAIIAVFAKHLFPALRFFILGVSLFFFGFLLAKKLCPIGTFQALFILKEAIVLKLPIFLIFFLPLVTALLLGRIFCGWLCPLGAFQELIFRIFKKLKIKTIKISKKWQGFLKTIPFLILTVVVAAGLTSQQMLFCRLDPFGYLFGKTRGLIPLFLLIGLSLLLPFFFRPFCRYLCPYGAVLSLLSRFSIFRLKIEKKKCGKCRLCEKTCPIEAISREKINFNECILCQECQKICPQRGIYFSKSENSQAHIDKIATNKHA